MKLIQRKAYGFTNFHNYRLHVIAQRDFFRKNSSADDRANVPFFHWFSFAQWSILRANSIQTRGVFEILTFRWSIWKHFSETLRCLAPRIILGNEQLRIHINLKNLGDLVSIQPKPIPSDTVRNSSELPNVASEIKNNEVIISAEVNLKFTRGRTELLDSSTGKVVSPSQNTPNPTLIRVIVQAEFWRKQNYRKPDQASNWNIETSWCKPQLR